MSRLWGGMLLGDTSITRWTLPLNGPRGCSDIRSHKPQVPATYLCVSFCFRQTDRHSTWVWQTDHIHRQTGYIHSTQVWLPLGCTHSEL